MRSTILATAALGALLVGCSSEANDTANEPEAAAETFRVSGQVVLVDREGIDLGNPLIEDERLEGDACAGVDFYGDLIEGAQVSVANASGKVLGIGELRGGRMTIGSWDMEGGGSGNGVTDGCAFVFEVPEVPADGDIYSLTVGNRDPFNFTSDKTTALVVNVG